VDIKFFVTAVVIQRDGGNLAETAEHRAHHPSASASRRAHAHRARRFSGIILSILPVFMAFLITSSRPIT
jgi:Flp pilus assembly protein TadB